MDGYVAGDGPLPRNARLRRLAVHRLRNSLLFSALTLATGAASAQRADTTAASEAVDAFGLSGAGETIGLYSDKYVRGFSPVDAGNLRLDGL